MDRPLNEISLPLSGKTAKVVTYFLRGETKVIEAKKYEGAKTRFVGGETVIDEIPTDFVQREEDALLLQGVKMITNDTGTEQPFTQRELDQLPDSDSILLLKELRKVQSGITDDAVSRKK